MAFPEPRLSEHGPLLAACALAAAVCVVALLALWAWVALFPSAEERELRRKAYLLEEREKIEWCLRRGGEASIWSDGSLIGCRIIGMTEPRVLRP